MTHTEWIVSLDDDLKDHDEMFVGNVRDGEMLTRCKDCEHFHVYEVSDIKLFQCERVRMNVILMDEDDYCSRAERKVKSSVYE